jgi:hypothetical protein
MGTPHHRGSGVLTAMTRLPSGTCLRQGDVRRNGHPYYREPIRRGDVTNMPIGRARLSLAGITIVALAAQQFLDMANQCVGAGEFGP